jgi:predicted MPP superfamily phosphohydrolase
MVLLGFITAILSILLLFASFLAYAFGSEMLCVWTSWAGWCGATAVFFFIIGTAIIKALETLIPTILEKLTLPKHRLGAVSGEGFDHRRRRFLQHSLNVGLVAASGSLAFYGVAEGLSLPRVKETDIRIDHLPPDLEGFRIVQITDLHISAGIRRNYVENLVARSNALSADLIALTGDIVDGTCTEMSYNAEPLAGLTARLGKFFVTGNHEYWHGVEAWIREMERMGFTVLMNDHRLIAQGSGLMLLGGVADYSAPSRGSHASSPAKAMGAGSAADVKILLAHQPRSIYEAARAGFDLQLSGHTHGGQLGPFRWLNSMGQPFQSGLYRYENTQIYVSNGAGYWGLPMRIGAPSEISLLILRKSGVSREENAQA